MPASSARPDLTRARARPRAGRPHPVSGGSKSGNSNETIWSKLHRNIHYLNRAPPSARSQPHKSKRNQQQTLRHKIAQLHNAPTPQPPPPPPPLPPLTRTNSFFNN